MRSAGLLGFLISLFTLYCLVHFEKLVVAGLNVKECLVPVGLFPAELDSTPKL